MILRPYQEAAKAAFYSHLQSRSDNPCVVIPTGGGKTPLLASICRDVVREWNGRVLVLAHVRELLVQAAEKLIALDPTLPVGVYSAGLNRRERSQPITVAGIQSIFRKACDFEPFDLILVDEAHLIQMDGDGMYRSFLADCQTINPDVRIGGLTATPYRLDKGVICTPDGILNHICHETRISDLIHQGFLCTLRSRAGATHADLSKVKKSGGEFKADQMAEAFDQSELVSAACQEIVELTTDRKGIIIFAASVEHGLHVQSQLRSLGMQCGFVCGETPTDERDKLIGDFKRQTLRCLVNVNVLTLGFDATHVDCVVLLRATMSPGLYYQMVGRGFRIHPGKQDCLVLDYGENVRRHGPVDAIRIKERRGVASEISGGPVKECPDCHTLIHAAFSTCPHCGFAFPARELNHGTNADGTPILSGEITEEEFEVRSVRYSKHTKKNAKESDPPTLRVDYSIGWETWKSEWVCFEHQGFAQRKAADWWRLRSTLPIPKSVDEALSLCRADAVTMPTKIIVREVSGERFPRIVRVEIGEPFVPGESWTPPEFTPKKQTKVFTPTGWDFSDPEESVTTPAYREEEIPF